MKMTFDEIYNATLAENSAPAPVNTMANSANLQKDLQGLFLKHKDNPALFQELEKQMKQAQQAAQQAAKANQQQQQQQQAAKTNAQQPSTPQQPNTSNQQQNQPQANNQQNNQQKRF
jgi:hypothetical protein